MATRCLLAGCGPKRSLAGKTGIRFGRFISTREKKLQEGQQQHYASTSEPSIPLVPKNRDPHAVLKALSSTVTPMKYPLVLGRSQADPLAACNIAQQMQFTMAQEAGKKAAEYVINRYPSLFPWKQPIPDLRNQYIRNKEVTEDNLNYLIAQRDSSQALNMFKELNEKGVPLSMETQNSLLGLLAYLGKGSAMADQEPTAKRKEEEMAAVVSEAVKVAEEAVEAEGLEEEESEQQLDGDAEASLFDKSLEVLPNMVIPEWINKDNPAEKFFAEMPVKDGGSYAAMICGLVKFKNYSRAFSLFEEAREKNLQIDVNAYNQLLLAILFLRVPNVWDRAKKLVAEMSKGPVVKPNPRTISLLLELTRHNTTDSAKTAAMVMRESTHLGFKPTLTTLMRVLDADTKLSSEQLLQEIINYVETHPEILNIVEHTDTRFFSLAIQKAKYLSDTNLTIRIKKLAMKDNLFLVQHIPFFLSTVFSIIAQPLRGVNIDLLLSEYRSVVPIVYVPHEWVYNQLLLACITNERPDIAVQLWKDIVIYRVQLTKPELLYKVVAAFRVGVKQEYEQYISIIDHVWIRLLYNDWQPTISMASVPVKLCVKNGQLDKAWEYYAKFEEYGLKPTFPALSSLLAAHFARGDEKEVFEILDKMILLGYWLPQSHTREICYKLKASPEERDRILNMLERNWHKNRDGDGTGDSA